MVVTAPLTSRYVAYETSYDCKHEFFPRIQSRWVVRHVTYDGREEREEDKQWNRKGQQECYDPTVFHVCILPQYAMLLER